MFRFKNFETASNFTLRCRPPAMIYDGPEDDYVVALGAEARRLEVDGHVAYTLAETAKAAGEGRESL